ncbi:hypothetical protein [Geoalkalibacter halelectricus]|uniref:spermine/spermidine synthase domain-containing protein n=1 Tax=Geoalkalibacter halelectricus TaxID=2847045 RepID=UPI003D221E24
MNNSSTLDRRTCWGMFLLCMATLMYELVLTRIFSVLMWYHFASMAISLALFGLGAAALTIALAPRWFPLERGALIAARWSALFAVGVALFFGLFVLFRLYPQFGFTVLSFFHQPHYQPFQQGPGATSVPAGMLPALAALYLVTAFPFYCSGLAVTLLLTRHLRDINRLYCWDLLGAGAGCLAIIAVLNLVGGITAILVIAALGLAAAALFLPADAPRGRRAGLWLVLAVLTAAGIGNYVADYAEIRFARGRYEPGMIWSGWNSFSRVAVYPSQGQEQERAWGLSRSYRGPIPEQLGMVIDDSGYTTLFRRDDERFREFFRANVISLAYALRPGAAALAIGPGGGKDVLVALAADAARVTAVELNSLIAEAVNERFAAFSGELYRDPRVRLVVDEGRSFVRRSSETFDVIQASAVFGRMAPAAGAFTLSENNLYTVEAFRDYWERLSDDGILSVSRFIFERETLRLVSLGLELLKEKGVEDPAAHLVVIRERGLANFMLKRSPFTTEELSFLREEARAREYDLVFMPDARDGDSHYHRLIASQGSDAFYREFPFDIRPVSDDRPFFYYMLKPEDFLRLLTFPEQSPFEDRAILTLRNLLVVVTGLVLVCLLLPLALLRGRELRTPGTAPRLLYFACLGLGFMLIEIGLLRRFTVFLGPPIYALAVVLFALLVFAGIGSLLAARCGPGAERRMLLRLLPALILLSLVYVAVLPPVLTSWLTLPLLLRCVLAVVLLAPLGLILGMPLPLGMRAFHPTPAAVPWSWGINSATSVFGAIFAAVLSMNFGFTLTLLAGVGVYLVGLAAVWWYRPG